MFPLVSHICPAQVSMLFKYLDIYRTVYINIGLRVRNEVTNDELEAARKKNEIDKKMRDMLREISYLVIFLLLLIYVATGSRDANVFIQNNNLKTTFHTAEVPKVIFS